MSSIKRKTPINTNHHVKLNALEEVSHFRDDNDKKIFIYIMKIYAIIYGVKVYCYSLVGKDIDICCFDEKGKISVFIQCIKSIYCKWYNRKYDRAGTLYKDRFKNEIIKDENLQEVIREIKSKSVTINDGSLVNSTLKPETVLNELCKYFEVSKNAFQSMVKANIDIASIATFCLRCFSSLMHKNIVKILRGISVTMSSTLSLNGVELIEGKYSDIYYGLLMMVYSKSDNYCNSLI